MTQFTTDRRTIVKGAAWAVPAISVAVAAPALAASPGDGPNLSTSVSAGGTRDGDVLTISPATLRNSGNQETDGVTVEFSADVVIENLTLGGIDPGGLGITVSGKGTNTVTMTVPPSGLSAGSNIPPGGEWTSPLPQVLTFAAGSGAISLTVTVTAANGGVPFATTQELPAG